jgi:methyltransferase
MLDPGWFFALAGLLLVQRLHELALSRRHLRLLGPPDFGPARPEPLLLAFHGLFFAAPLAEVLWRGERLGTLAFALGLAALLLAQAVRQRTQVALGRYWTVLPAAWRGQRLVRSGPYRYGRHPNYAAVALEVLAFPAAGGAWWSLLLLNLLHPLVLIPRIAQENRALAALAADPSPMHTPARSASRALSLWVLAVGLLAPVDARTTSLQAPQATPDASNPPTPVPPLAPQLRRYRLDADASRVGFDGRSTLHDWSARTSALTGTLVSGYPEHSAISGAQVVALAAKLDSENGLRDDEMRSRLDVKTHPELRFQLTEARALPASGEVRTLELTGDFLIHGVSQGRRLEAQVSPRGAGLGVSGRVAFPMSEHGITPPDLVLVTVSDRIEVWFDLLWRPVEEGPLLADGQRTAWRSEREAAGQAALLESGEARLFWAETGGLLELADEDRWIVSGADGARSLRPTRQLLEGPPVAIEAELEASRSKLEEARRKLSGLSEAQRARAGASLEKTIARLEASLALAPAGEPRREAGPERDALFFGERLWFEAKGRAAGAEGRRVGPLLAVLPGLPAAVRAELQALDGVPAELTLVQLEGSSRRTLSLSFGRAEPALLGLGDLAPESWCQAPPAMR